MKNQVKLMLHEFNNHRLKTSEHLIPHPSAAAECAAGKIYALPNNTDSHVDTLLTKTDSYRQIMRHDANTLAVEHNINRALCKATVAPIYHMMELEADRRFLGSIGSQSFYLEKYTSGLKDYTPPILLEGEYADFARITGMVNQWASDRVLEQIENPKHPYHRSWQYFGEFLPRFAATELQVRGYKRSSDPVAETKATFDTLGTDSALPVLMQAVYQFWEKRNIRGRAQTAHELFRHVEQFGWFARGKRNFFAAHFPLSQEQPDATPSCPYKPTGQNTFSAGGQGDRSVLWENPGLMGIDNIAGFCPASIEMTPPVKEAQLVIEGMFKLLDSVAPMPAHRIHSRLFGTAMAAELNLIRSIVLLDLTVLRRFD